MRFQRVLADPHAPADFAQLPKRLSADGGLHAYLRADGRAIGNSADALDFEPIVRVAVVAIQGVVFGADDPAVRYEQIQETVIVVVAPGATYGIGNVLHRTAAKNPREGTVAIVVIESISAGILSNAGSRRHKQIDEPIIVIVTPSALVETRR